MSRLSLSAGLLPAFLLSSTALSPAFAQVPTDEIIVTAQKREQTLQEVPVSVDIVSGEELGVAKSGAEDILFLSAKVPSVYAEGSFGRTFPRFYIRGLGNTDFDLNANQPVSLVYDGVVLENPILKGFPVFDVEQIEVLRGPQGTLFGRNTPAGVIQFQSARPTDDVEGYGRLAYGRFDTIDAEGAISGPLSDTVSARLSGLFQRRDAYVDNTLAGQPEDDFEGFEEFAGRFQLLFDPSTNYTALLNVHARSLSGGSRTFRANAIEQGVGGLVDGFDRFEATQDATQLLDVDNVGASLTIEADFGPGTLTSISALETVTIDARGDVDGGFGADFLGNAEPGSIPFSAESQDNIPGHQQWTQELRYNFDASESVNVTLGGFAFIENLKIESLSFDTLAGGVVNGQAFQFQDTTALAVFASVDAALTDRLSVVAGLRLSDEDKDFSATRTFGPFGAPFLGPLEESLDSTDLSGDLTLAYDVNPNVNVYAKYARSFRAPNVQGRIVFGDVVTVADTETIDSIETGFKSSILDGRGFFNATAFYYMTDDQQLTAVGGAGNFNQLLNAEGVEGFGFELDTAINPTDQIELTAGLSYNNTSIEDDTLEVGVCGSPCTVQDPINALTGNALINGNPLPQAPKWIANASARYGVPVSANSEVFVFGDISHRSQVNFFLYDSVEFESDSLTEVGLRGGYVHNDGEFEVAAFGRNIFGVTALEGAVDFNNLTGFLNEPAFYGVEVLKRF